MSDEELRQALRQAEVTKDEAELRKLIFRMPWEMISDLYQTWLNEKNWLETKCNLICEIGPRCHCNCIGEPYCPNHQNVLIELAKAKKEYDETSAGLRKQLASIAYAQAYVNAGFPNHTTNLCHFPECQEKPYSRGYCGLHGSVLIPGFEFKESQARKRKQI